MTQTEQPPAFFTERDGELIPSPAAQSPWSADMLHGRLIGGLAARAVERGHLTDGLRAARVTVDLFRGSPLVPLRVESRTVRDGRRIRVVDVEIASARGAIGRASVVLLRGGGTMPGEVAVVPPREMPPPGDLTTGAGPVTGWTPPFDLHWRLADNGDGDARRVAWTREIHPLVAGEPVSPLVRAALAADFASPLSNFGPEGLYYINADYTLTLSRPPLGELVGLEVTGRLSEEGVSTGVCVVHDESGPIGHCVVTALANPRMGD
ncbi:hypothetical protein C1I98_28635 [Spongiactinospora gelatinilytica]|uniref:Thioesterase family protein n=1 Tax=Spongiactinospora gelatinilytica TaxID=2666298 RepID=A0A2W2H3P5_9ACTN|nr:acyl-CoA thioesterase domain-containing protein [Spongiactinospora gelatinilytica]PZG33624.1 hypothetical protein C1I98_28635 [Spongiactinospora gelatinilytica]